MISVVIYVNGHPVTARSAIRIKGEKGICEYFVDDGSIIKHDFNDGAVALAKKLLDTVKEKKSKNKCIRKIIEGKVEHDNRGNGGFSEWWSLNGDTSNKWLKEFEGKDVKITVEEKKK